MAEYAVIAIIVAVLVVVAVRYFSGSVAGGVKDAKSGIDRAAEDETNASGPSQEEASSAGVSEAGDLDTGSEREAEDDTLPVRSQGPDSVSADIGALADSMDSGVGVRDQASEIQFRLDPLTLVLIALMICAMGFFLVSRLLDKKDRSSSRKKRRGALLRFKNSAVKDESGQAMVEFVLTIITFLFCVLGVIQLALILNAYTLVRYAAHNAARAGIVHSADPEKMQEAARLSLVSIFPRHGRADHLRGITENYLGAVATDQRELDDFDKPITEVTLEMNRTAQGAGGGGIVTFDDPAQAENAVITVRVIHHYEMVIPLVNRILYFLYFKFLDDDYAGEDVDQLAAKTDRLRRDGEFEDIEYRFPLVARYTMRMQSDYDPSAR